MNSVMGYWCRDKNHLIKESGDIAWYLAEAATALDVPLDTILQGNLDKLHKRYPDEFSINAFINRQKEDWFYYRVNPISLDFIINDTNFLYLRSFIKSFIWVWISTWKKNAYGLDHYQFPSQKR